MSQKKITPVVLVLILINVGIHLISVFSDSRQSEEFQIFYMTLWKWGEFGLPPGVASQQPVPFNFWQPLGSAFAHSKSLHIHIFLNMLCLFFFGPALERAMGSLKFLFLYLWSAIIGGLLAAFFVPSLVPAVGASGAISGLLVAFAMLYPQARIGILFIPVFLPSRVFTGLFALISLGLVVYQYIEGKNVGGISHIGHFAGMVAGFIFMVFFLITHRADQQEELAAQESPEEAPTQQGTVDD